jgi:hypothetical protein
LIAIISHSIPSFPFVQWRRGNQVCEKIIPAHEFTQNKLTHQFGFGEPNLLVITFDAVFFPGRFYETLFFITRAAWTTPPAGALYFLIYLL